MVEDSALLNEFCEKKVEEAFSELVRRHVDLVYSVALRHVGFDSHLAEDVSQEVFCVLARKATSLRKEVVLGAWLCRTAHFVAKNLMKKERRRQIREKEAEQMREIEDSTKDENDLEGMRLLLDEAISELGERDRSAVWLRYFEEKSFGEIGERLSVNENTARMRVNRSLDKLRDFLRRKGIKSSAATLAATLGGQATIAAPAGLAQAISASAAATGSGLLISVFGIMNTTKVIGLVAVSAVAIGSVVYLAQDDNAPDLASEHRLEDKASEPPPEAIAPQRTEEADLPEADGSTAPLETAEERYEHRKAELARLKEEEAISQSEYIIRLTLLNSEIALNRKKENPTPVLTEEERLILKRVNELIKTNKEAAHDLILASMTESSSRGMYFMAGNTYGESGETDMALDFYKTALDRKDGQNWNLDRRLNRNVGMMLVQQNKHEEAKQYLQQAIYLTNEPDDVLQGVYGLAEISTGNLAAAEYHYRQAVALNPEEYDWSLGLAKALLNQEKHEEANVLLEDMLDRFFEK